MWRVGGGRELGFGGRGGGGFNLNSFHTLRFRFESYVSSLLSSHLPTKCDTARVSWLQVKKKKKKKINLQIHFHKRTRLSG